MTEIDDEMRVKIERHLAELRDPDSETSKRMRAFHAERDALLAPLIAKIRASETLTSEDFQTLIQADSISDRRQAEPGE